jgi:hypothetical protein
VVRTRSTGGADGPVSVADLLTRHGHVLRDDPTATATAPGPGDGDGPRGFPARWRRTLVAVGCVLAAGSVLGGAVAVGNAGHEAPLGPVPGGLLDQLTRGSTAGDPYAPPREPVLVEEVSGRPAPAGVPLPRSPGSAPAAPAAGAVPAPRAPGAAERVPAAPAAPAPAAGRGTATDRDAAVPAPVVVPERAAPATEPERGDSSAPDAPAQVPPPAPAEPAPAPAPPAGSSGDPVGGLLGGVTDTVGGLLGG